MAIKSSFISGKAFSQRTGARAPGGGRAARDARDAIARLRQHMGSDPCSGERIDTIARWLVSCPAHPAAQALHQTMAELAWLGGPRAALDGAALQAQLDSLIDALDQAPTVLLARCDAVRTLVCGCVESRLRAACRQDCQSAQPYGQAWVMACSELLLTHEGAVDAAVFPALEQLLERTLDHGAADWLPADWQDDARCRLRQLMDPGLKLPAQVDKLSSTEPLHPQVERLRRLQFVGSARPARHQLATLVLCLHLTPPRQPNDMGVCWLLAPKAMHHLSQPARVLQACTLWFEQGLLECPGPSNQNESVEPSLYPVHALQWAARPAPDEDTAQSPVVARLLHALLCVQPGADEAHWWQLLRSVAQELRQTQGRATRLQLLRGVLMAHLNAAHGWALTEGRLARPAQRQSPGLRDKAAHLEACLQDCLAVIESDTLNLLTACWQLGTSQQVRQDKLQACWAVLEPVLLDGLDAQALADLPAYLAQLRALFLSCADLCYERHAKSGDTGFRLQLRVPGAPGRGTPVGNADQLLEWIACFSRELVKGAPRSSFAHHHAALMIRIARAKRGEFAQRLSAGGAPLRPVDALEGGIWFLDVGARFETGAPALSLPSGVRSEDFVELHLAMSSLRWEVVAVLDAWVAPRQTLVNLVRMMRSVQALAGPDLRFALKRMHGRLPMYVPQDTSGQGAHVMSLFAQNEALQTLYSETGDIDEAIGRLLVQPMRQALRQRLQADEAMVWLTSVLQSCRLKPGADLDAAVQQVLAQAVKHTHEAASDCGLQWLVRALRLLQSSATDSPFLTPDPWHNGLSVAVLNALPFELPVLVYGDPNWEGKRLVLYCEDPILRDIAHFSANEWLTPTGERRLRLVAVCPCFLF